jgi:hypothetical protein
MWKRLAVKAVSVVLISICGIKPLLAQASPQQKPGDQVIQCLVHAALAGGLSPSQIMCFANLLLSLPAPRPDPGTTTAIPRQPQSIAEVGEIIMNCYHPTGIFTSIQIIEVPWRAQHDQWNADHSALLFIEYRGKISGGKYAMLIGLVERQGEIRTVIVDEKKAFPPSPSCALNKWVKLT